MLIIEQSESPPPLKDGDLSSNEDAALAEVLKSVPRGAFALAGLTVGMLMASWLFVYFFIFLARGAVS